RSAMKDDAGRRRVVIENVRPEIDCGRFPIKRVRGDLLVVEADAFTDGHDLLSCVLLFRRDGEAEWTTVPMDPLRNDRWRGVFTVSEVGLYRYTIKAWIDRFGSWRRDFRKRVEAGQDVAIDRLVGAELVQ